MIPTSGHRATHRAMPFSFFPVVRGDFILAERPIPSQIIAENQQKKNARLREIEAWYVYLANLAGLLLLFPDMNELRMIGFSRGTRLL